MRARLRIWFLTVVVSCVLAHSAAAGQRVVKISGAWVRVPAEGAVDTTAFVTVENGTMYEVYIVSVETDLGMAELRQATADKVTPLKEAPIPAFDRLEMAPEGVHIHLSGLKRPVKVGETVALVLTTDGGQPLQVDAVVK